MAFDYDVFISYPHISNVDDDNNYNGWVAKFHDRLKRVLTDLLGREAQIWRDNKLQAGAPFGDAIIDKLSKSRVFLCVISPAYTQSEWCLKELKGFLRLARQSGNLKIGEHSRVLPVIKTYVASAQRPSEIKEFIYKEFYKKDENLGGVPLEFGQEAGERGYEDYKTKMQEVAWSILNTIEQLGDNSSDDIRKTIFLGETTNDIKNEHDKIRSELVAREFIVLPDKPLPRDDANSYREAVQSYLQRSFLSIHLMGKSYGMILEGEEESVVYLQNEWAAERSKQDNQFKRLIWISQNLDATDRRQIDFLNRLQNSEEAQNGAEILIRLFEGFKTRLQQILTKPKHTPPDNLISIYLMCDKPDFDYIPYVGKYLYNKGYEVKQLSRTDDTLQYHKSHLLYCDATLILYGKTHKGWVDERHYDTTKRVKGWGRESDILCKAIFITNPETEEKHQLFIQSAKILPCYEELSNKALETSLNEFINDLEQAFSN